MVRNIKTGAFKKVWISSMVLVAFWAALVPLAPALADPLPDSELQALNEEPNYLDNACSSTAGAGAAGSGISGGLQSLAQQIISNKNITYDYGPNGPTGTQFKRIANGQKAQTDTGRQVDVQPIVLVALLHLAQSHKVQVSALTDGSSHTAPNNPHGMGDAMDIDFLDGAGTNGSDAVANKIISDLEQVLPSGSRFGMGNGPFGTQKVNGKTFTSFIDNPNHVHFDVVGVSQAADDAAAGLAASPSASPAPGGGGGCCPGGGATTLTGGNNVQQSFNYFVGKGLTPNQSAGIVGNLEAESGAQINPEAVEGGGSSKTPTGGGWGIAQWTPGTGIIGIARSVGVSGPIYELSTQLDIIWGEISKGSESQVLHDLKSTNSVEDAVLAFQGNQNVGGKYIGFERPADEAGSVPARTTYAKQALTKYGGGAAGGGVAGNCPTSAPGKVNIIKHDAFGNADGPMGHQPTMIGLHYTAGNEQTVDDVVSALADPTGAKHCNKNCSVQLTVDPKGNVYQLTSSLNVITENIINFNDADIGIEIMGPNEQALLNNKAQFDAVTALVTQLMQQYNIKMVQDFKNKAGLMGHMECDDWSQGHLGDHFSGIYKSDPPVQSTDGHTDPGKTYMSKVRAVVGPALGN